MTWQTATGTVRSRYISGIFGVVPAYRGTRLNIALLVSIIMLEEVLGKVIDGIGEE